jgi:SAM-dependent methyltransferase
MKKLDPETSLLNDLAAVERIQGRLVGELKQMPLPPEELRMHVGARPTTSNFLLQGRASSRKVLSVFGESPTVPFLDWGCGSGRTLRWLLKHPAWAEFYRGVDVDPMAINWLKAQGVKNVELSNASAIELPYGDGELGGLFSFSVLTHIHPQHFRTWLVELARVLRPGARAYLTFNGDRITESTHPAHVAPAEEFRQQGWAWIDLKRGHYKAAAFASHAFVESAAQGLFKIDRLARLDYNDMDALYGVRI